jgi:hypothetical protein
MGQHVPAECRIMAAPTLAAPNYFFAGNGWSADPGKLMWAITGWPLNTALYLTNARKKSQFRVQKAHRFGIQNIAR